MLASHCDLHHGEIGVERKLKGDGNLEKDDRQKAALFWRKYFLQRRTNRWWPEDQYVYVVLDNGFWEVTNMEICQHGRKPDRKDYPKKGKATYGESGCNSEMSLTFDFVVMVTSAIYQGSFYSTINWIQSEPKSGGTHWKSVNSWLDSCPASAKCTVGFQKCMLQGSPTAFSNEGFTRKLPSDNRFLASKWSNKTRRVANAKHWIVTECLQREQAFCTTGLLCGVLECHWDPRSYEACRIVAPNWSLIATRVLHALKSASEYFQSTIPPVFHEIQKSIKTWLHYRIIHTKTEQELSNVL